MCDYIKPELRHYPDAIILHYGTKNIPNEMSTTQNMSEFVISTSIHKILEINSSFHVKQRTTGKVQFLFFSSCLLY